MRAYANMVSRQAGRSKPHLYKDIEVLPKEDFYAWAATDPVFLTLYRNWKKSGYPRSLSPTVRRVDPEEGYTLDNMTWTTHSTSSAVVRKGNRDVLERLAATYAPTQ